MLSNFIESKKSLCFNSLLNTFFTLKDMNKQLFRQILAIVFNATDLF